MSSTTRLLVLGVVKLFQPVHGYVVRRELLSWRAQDWASIQSGSIYNALKTLTRDGLLEVASTDQVGGRPERTTYRLTRAGMEEFHTLLREEWWNVRVMVDPLMSAVSFLGEVPRHEAIAALEQRATQIQGMVRHTEFAIAAHDPDESPDHVCEMMRLLMARLTSELAWSEQFLARLRNGEYRTADEPRWVPRSALAEQPAAPDRDDDAPSAPEFARRPASKAERPGRTRRTGRGRPTDEPRPPPRGSGSGESHGLRGDRAADDPRRTPDARDGAAIAPPRDGRGRRDRGLRSSDRSRAPVSAPRRPPAPSTATDGEPRARRRRDAGPLDAPPPDRVDRRAIGAPAGRPPRRPDRRPSAWPRSARRGRPR